MADQLTIQDTVKQGFKQMMLAFLTNGVVEDSKKLKFKDMLVSPDANVFMPQVISRVIKKAIEPRLVISNMFQTIRLAAGTSIDMLAMGALEAEEVGETGTYPEKALDVGGGNMTHIKVTKYGLRVAISEEMIADSQWDVIGLHLEAAGKAMARKKEKVCADLFATFGQKIFDNAEVSTAVVGGTTGRAINGAANGTFHLDDVFDMYAYLLNSGFNGDRLLMHPLSWLMWAKDPILREIAMTANKMYGGTLSGAPGETGWDKDQNLGYKTMNPNASTTMVTLPASLFPTPIGVVVSPYVRYIPKGATLYKQSDGTAATSTAVTDGSGLATAPVTDVYMLDSNSPGLIVQREDVSTEQFDDPARDIRNLKIRERYGVAVQDQGKGIAVARNVKIAKSYVFDNVNSATVTTEVTRNI